MAGVNLAEDGQSMTREFLNGRLCKRGNNLQPRSKGARVADVTGFLAILSIETVFDFSNPTRENNLIGSAFNWKLFIHANRPEIQIGSLLIRRILDWFLISKGRGGYETKLIRNCLETGVNAVSVSRSCHRARSIDRSIDTTLLRHLRRIDSALTDLSKSSANLRKKRE